MKTFALVLPLTAALLAGCVQSIALSTMGGLLDKGFSAFTEESDLDFAGKALPGNLKLLEVMLKNDPDDARLLLLASQGYSSYALGFLEDDSIDAARMMYLRGRDFGLRILRQDPGLAGALDGSVDDLNRVLAGAPQSDVPALFWTAFGWGGYVYLSLTQPDAIADIPRMEAIMNFVARVDSGYYFDGADTFLGTLYGSRPKILGGDPGIARQHFEKALRVTKGKFLLTYVYYARSYAVQTQNKELFEELLTRVDTTSLDVLPEYRLANAIAKKKAKLLRAQEPDLF